MSVATDIKAARKAVGLTQKEAAEKWGIPLSTLIKWENNLRQPRGLALRQLEQILSGAAGSPSKHSRKKA